jgi:hypothetical protein
LVHFFRRNQQRNVAAAFLQLLRDGEAGKKVAARAATRDGD